MMEQWINRLVDEWINGKIQLCENFKLPQSLKQSKIPIIQY